MRGMFLKPKKGDNKKNKIRITKPTLEGVNQILQNGGVQTVTPENLNQDFKEEYLNTVFTTKEQLTELINSNNLAKQKVYVFLVGLSGAGHFYPAYTVAKQLAKEENNVVFLLDITMLESFNSAIIRSELWNFFARYWHFGWEHIVRKFVANEKLANFAMKGTRKLYTQDVKTLFEKLKINTVISTFPYSNCVLSLIQEDKENNIENIGIIVTDVEPHGFVINPFAKFARGDRIQIFLPTVRSKNMTRELYKWTQNIPDSNFHITGGNPTFVDNYNFQKYNIQEDLLLATPGSCVGIGKGIKGLETIANNWRGKIIFACGSNKKWLRRAKEFVRGNNFQSRIFVTGMIERDIYEKLFSMSRVIIGKCGGSFGIECAASKKVVIIYESIGGQETANVDWLSNNGCIVVAKNKNELANALKNLASTPSIREEKIKEIPTKVIIDAIR